jgi:glycosyltransferase involved in cell wall biosynthesis
MKIAAYCLDWHLKNSDAFKDLLIDPLKPYIDIELTAWDGEKLPNKPENNSPLIFCMLPPTPEILKVQKQKIIWIPMWDQAQGYDDRWWAALPNNLHIVAFSKQILNKAKAHNLPVIYLQYYKNPSDLKRASWQQGRVLFYWNRVGMVGPKFIERICNALKIDTLLFKPDIDPRIEDNKYYDLPKKIGNTKVTTIHTTKTRDEFLQTVEPANIILSPRLSEGAGMVFIEAMARGCAVIAHDAPTMNEYIKNRKTGILVSNFRKRLGLGKKPIDASSYAPFLLSPEQNWQQIGKLNLEKIGNNAYRQSLEGYQQWHDQAKEYASFIVEN